MSLKGASSVWDIKNSLISGGYSKDEKAVIQKILDNKLTELYFSSSEKQELLIHDIHSLFPVINNWLRRSYENDDSVEISDELEKDLTFCEKILNGKPIGLIESEKVFSQPHYIWSRALIKIIRINPTTNGLLDQIALILAEAFSEYVKEETNSQRKVPEELFMACCDPNMRKRNISFCEGVSQYEGTTHRCRNYHYCNYTIEDHGIITRAINTMFKQNHDTIYSEKSSNTLKTFLSFLNRWNELAGSDRLKCNVDGCDSVLLPNWVSNTDPFNVTTKYGVVYFKCSGNVNHTEEIKITYCIGCGSMIDSRESIYWCENHYKGHDYHLCKKCGSCCNSHNGPAHTTENGQRIEPVWAGICPNCGDESWRDWKSESDSNYSKGAIFKHVTCNKCSHTLVLPKSFSVQDSIYKYLDQADLDGGLGINAIKFENHTKELHGNGITVYYTDVVLDPFGKIETYKLYNTRLLGTKLNENDLIVHDWYLFSMVLRMNNLSIDFNRILDYTLLNKLTSLGLEHPRYEKERKSHHNQMKQAINDFKMSLESTEVDDPTFNILYKSLLSIKPLLQKNPALFTHYEYIELPFASALSKLTSSGISISHHALKDELFKTKKHIDTLHRELEGMGFRGVPNNLDDVNRFLNENTDPTLIIRLLQNLEDCEKYEKQHRFFHVLHELIRAKRFANISKQLKGNVVYPRYSVIGSTTLRCTSKSPNIMGLPKKYRHVVVPRSSDRGIVSCDYKQMELGIAAALSGDALLISDFGNSDIYNRFVNSTGTDRKDAKLLFLGILYGMSAKTSAGILGCTEDAVDKLKQMLLGHYPALNTYLIQSVTDGINIGYAESITGVRRYTQNRANGDTNRELAYWERNWFRNYPIQASAATCFKKAIILLNERVDHSEFNLLVPHYDAIVFEAPLMKIKDYTKIVTLAMIDGMKAYFDLAPQIDSVPNPEKANFDEKYECWKSGE